jgi:hypothetical protein
VAGAAGRSGSRARCANAKLAPMQATLPKTISHPAEAGVNVFRIFTLLVGGWAIAAPYSWM